MPRFFFRMGKRSLSRVHRPGLPAADAPAPAALVGAAEAAFSAVVPVSVDGGAVAAAAAGMSAGGWSAEPRVVADTLRIIVLERPWCCQYV